MDPTTLATTAVTALAPFLTEAGKEAAKRTGGAAVDTAKQLYDFLKKKLISPGASEALTELEKTPHDEDARTMLHLKLQKLLTDDPHLREELAALLRTLAPEAGKVTQTANVAGNDNAVAQVVGSGNTVMVGNRK